MQISAYEHTLEPAHPPSPDLAWRFTGGPRGQLAVHPAVAQFLLDNAASTALEENTGINAIDEILNILPMGFELVNGYLKIHDVDSKSESETLELLLKYLTLGYARVEVMLLWWKSMGVSRFFLHFGDQAFIEMVWEISRCNHFDGIGANIHPLYVVSIHTVAPERGRIVCWYTQA